MKNYIGAFAAMQNQLSDASVDAAVAEIMKKLEIEDEDVSRIIVGVCNISYRQGALDMAKAMRNYI